MEYKNEAYNAFQNLTSSMYDDYLRTLLRLEIAAKPAAEGAPAGAGRPAPAALAEQEDPLARKMSYSAPEQALEESSIRGRHAAAARAASGVPAAPPRPAAGKPQTYVKDKVPLRQRGAQRSLPLRFRQEVQEVPRPEPLTASVRRELRGIPPVLKQH